MDAFGFGDDDDEEAAATEEAPAATEEAPAATDGDIDYGAELKVHINAALHAVLAKQDKDPFRAIQQILFAASLSGDDASSVVTSFTPEITAFMTTYGLQDAVDSCLGKLKKRLVPGPKDGFKFLLSDAGDFFTELSKKLKASGGVPTDISMTPEQLKAKDEADKKAKREKEAQAEKERDAADAINAQKTAEMETSGKKVSGGLHKFDASEVDINGGTATADDFMDAFGFGDDDDEAAEENSAADGIAELISIQVTPPCP